MVINSKSLDIFNILFSDPDILKRQVRFAPFVDNQTDRRIGVEVQQFYHLRGWRYFLEYHLHGDRLVALPRLLSEKQER